MATGMHGYTVGPCSFKKMFAFPGFVGSCVFKECIVWHMDAYGYYRVYVIILGTYMYAGTGYDQYWD